MSPILISRPEYRGVRLYTYSSLYSNSVALYFLFSYFAT